MNLLIILSFVVGSHIESPTTFPNNAFDTIPSKVLTSFQDAYPENKSVRWQKIADQQYQARGYVRNNVFEAIYSSDGQLIRFIEYMNSKQLPPHLLAHLKDKFPGYKISSVKRYSNSKNGATFKLIIRSSDAQIIKELLLDDRNIVL